MEGFALTKTTIKEESNMTDQNISITTEEAINHAMGHLIQYQMGVKDESHLSQAMMRLMMAVEILETKDVDKSYDPNQGRIGTVDFLRANEEQSCNDHRLSEELNKIPRTCAPGPIQFHPDSFNLRIDEVFIKSSVAPPPCPVLYLCYPYKDDPEYRTEIIKLVARQIGKGRLFCDTPTVIVPHIMFTFLDEKADRVVIMAMCLRMVALCTKLIIVGDHISDGMSQEIAEAERLGKVIDHYSDVIAKEEWEVEHHRSPAKKYSTHLRDNPPNTPYAMGSTTRDDGL